LPAIFDEPRSDSKVRSSTYTVQQVLTRGGEREKEREREREKKKENDIAVRERGERASEGGEVVRKRKITKGREGRERAGR